MDHDDVDVGLFVPASTAAGTVQYDALGSSNGQNVLANGNGDRAGVLVDQLGHMLADTMS